MRFAPETPTDQELVALYPISDQVMNMIAVKRAKVSAILAGQKAGPLGIVGPCAETNEPLIIDLEGDRLIELDDGLAGAEIIHRLPPWKPRSSPDSWFGLETTSPETAFKILVSRAIAGPGLAIEIGHKSHLKRYAHLTSFIWMGGRSVNDDKLLEELSTYDTSLSLGIKNGIDGDIEPALRQITRAETLRGKDAAPVKLIYRGGENAKDPRDWARNYHKALEVTNSQMIVDSAHGTEMAHTAGFKKSVHGQELALEHIIGIARQGFIPSGIMMEASDASSPTDITMSQWVAIESLHRMRWASNDAL